MIASLESKNINRTLVHNGYIRIPWFIQSHDGSAENPYFMSQFLFSVNRKRGVSFKTGLLFMNPQINLEHF